MPIARPRCFSSTFMRIQRRLARCDAASPMPSSKRSANNCVTDPGQSRQSRYHAPEQEARPRTGSSRRGDRPSSRPEPAAARRTRRKPSSSALVGCRSAEKVSEFRNRDRDRKRRTVNVSDDHARDRAAARPTIVGPILRELACWSGRVVWNYNALKMNRRTIFPWRLNNEVTLATQQPATLRSHLIRKGAHASIRPPASSCRADIGISGDKIAAIEDPQSPPREERMWLDATGLFVTPGLIDLHTHCYYRRRPVLGTDHRAPRRSVGRHDVG